MSRPRELFNAIHVAEGAACAVVLAHYFFGTTAALIGLVISVLLVGAVLIARRGSASSDSEFQTPSDQPPSPRSGK